MDQLLKKNQELSTILDISRVLTRSFDLEKNLNEVMEILAANLEMQRGCVFLPDTVSREISIVAAYGLSPMEIRRGTYHIGEGIVGRVIESGSPMFIPNIGNEPKFLNKTESRPTKSGVSFFCIPMVLEKEILGVISVDRIYTEEHGNIDDDIRVLTIVGSLIAQFIKLWDLFEKTQQECGNLLSQLKERYSLPNIIGESPAFQQVLKSVRKVAGTDTTVLLLGESGTGKELIAQTLHYQSLRSKNPFIPINLAAIPENLVEAELFGVEKGAYTGASVRRLGRFESADKGTLFLDEIGELPMPLQVKLLRVLQEKSFERVGSSIPINSDVRIVAATNRNLVEDVRRGNFREDLYWRLNVVSIVMPPLRERINDIPLLLDHYLNKFNLLYRRQVMPDPEVISAMCGYAWPGNVRELANTVESMVIMCDTRRARFQDLPVSIRNQSDMISTPIDIDSEKQPFLGLEVERLERARILKALKENDFIQQRASRILGITPRQLSYRMKKYDIRLKRDLPEV
jgi:Nif-specific regulatory protein